MNILIYSILAIGFIDLLSFFSLEAINLVNVAMLHLIPILYIAIKSTHLKTFLISSLSAISFNFFFIPPKYAFVIHETRYWFSFIMMIVVGQLVTWLSQKAAKAKEIETSKRLQQTIIESLSHELRTPLSAIKGASSILVSKELKISDEDTQELYKSIDDGAERMRRLVDNLLDTARIHSGMLKLNIDECDITELLFSALQKTKNYDNVELLLEQDASRSILGDAVLIELALINLLDNAFKYGESIRIRLYEDNHGIYVQICNNGLVPMPYEIKEDYKPFERLNNVQGKEGLGLGLYVATSIAQMHGGTISVKSDGQEYCATIGFSNRITR